MKSTTIKVTVDGYRLHVLDTGSGAPVLLLHGFAGSSEEWRPTAEMLARSGYRALALDALGFGQSDKPDDAPYSLPLYARLIAGLLDTLGLEQATLVGHSFGGKCALATALLYTPRVRSIVIADSEGFIPIPLFMKKAGVVPGLAEAFLWMSKNPRLFRMQLVGTFYDAERIPPDFVEHFRVLLSDTAQMRALMQLSRCYDDHDLIKSGMRARLGELRLPALVVWGEQDRVFPVKCGRMARDEIPGARLATIPRCGHYPHIERARLFRGLLLGFLARHAGEPQ